LKQCPDGFYRVFSPSLFFLPFSNECDFVYGVGAFEPFYSSYSVRPFRHYVFTNDLLAGMTLSLVVLYSLPPLEYPTRVSKKRVSLAVFRVPGTFFPCSIPAWGERCIRAFPPFIFPRWARPCLPCFPLGQGDFFGHLSNVGSLSLPLSQSQYARNPHHN